MIETALRALNESIAHWERLVQMEPSLMGEDPSSEFCALCKMFLNKRNIIQNSNCSGCPIEERTGFIYCRGTPHSAAAEAWEDYLDDPNGKQLELWKTTAAAELAFLKSLLPK